MAEGAAAARPMTEGDRQTAAWLGFLGLILGQFMALLDVQVVASALAEVQAGVDATSDNISWVQSVYLLAEVIAMPTSALLTRLWSTRVFYIGATSAFVAASCLAGAATNMPMMVAARALQGLAAGAMIPPVLAAAMILFNPERRQRALVITGMVVTIAPTVGPIVGGVLTDLFGWRSVFYLNAPLGAVVIVLVGRYVNFDQGNPALARKIDWIGLGLLATALSAMQYILEEGGRHGWFTAPSVTTLALVSLVAGTLFVRRQWGLEHPLVSLRPFGDRNFALGFAVNLIVGFTLFGGVFLLPLFLTRILGYPPGRVGLAMITSGVALFVGGPVAGWLSRRLDARAAIMLGFGLTAAGLWHGARINDQWGFADLGWLQILRGLGIMIVLNAAQHVTMSTLPLQLMKDASALVYLVRNLGGAIGVAVMSAVLSHGAALYRSSLAERADAAAKGGSLQEIERLLRFKGLAAPEAAARALLDRLLEHKALMLAFGDSFALMSLGCVAGSCLALLVIPRSKT